MVCPKCKSEQPDNAHFCSQCSEPLTEHGKKLDRSKFPPWAFVVIVGSLLLMLLMFFWFSQSNSPNAKKDNDDFLRTMARRGPHLVKIVDSAITINAASYSWYTVVVPPGVTTINITGHFAATGGSGNDIECYVLDEDGFANFKNGHVATAFFNSGKVTQARIFAVLPTPGTYYVVLDNRFSLFIPKAVQIQATLGYEQ